jgi:type I restriction enzyme M protein
MEIAMFNDYFCALLLVKYISDRYNARLLELRAKFKEDEDMLQRRLRRERFIVTESCTFHYLYTRSRDKDIGNLINLALSGLAHLNDVKLSRIFRNVDFNNEIFFAKPVEVIGKLHYLISAIAELDFDPALHDDKETGEAFDGLLEAFANESRHSPYWFHTPRDLASLAAKLIQPQMGQTIYDPACGSGELLTEAAKEIGSQNFFIYGQENQKSLWALAQINMIFHGFDQSQIAWGHAIREPAFVDNENVKTFDRVISMPPFGDSRWGYEFAEIDPYRRFRFGLPPKSRSEFAYISHILASLRPGGIAAVFIQPGGLWRGTGEAKIREALIRENFIDAVIGLPFGLLNEKRLPLALLILKRNRLSKDILFIDATKDYGEGRKRNRLRDEDLEKITHCFHRRIVVDGYSALVGLEAIASSGFSLNLNHYIHTVQNNQDIDVFKIRSEMEQIDKELACVHLHLENCLQDLGL